MSGRLIGPKTWDLIVGIYGTRFGQFTGCFGWLCDNLCNKLWFRCFWVGNGHGFWFHKVKPMLGEWAALGQPVARLGTVKKQSRFALFGRKWFMCVVSKILLELNGLELCEK